MKNQYNKTIAACSMAYIVQAIIRIILCRCCFLTFQQSYGISLSRITLLVTFNFGIQLLVDLLAIGFVDRIGYRRSMVLAHLLAAAGLVSLTILPEVLADPFVGILTAVMIYAVGGGLLEVLVSPVVEACPSESQRSGDEYAALFLLLGACRGDIDFDSVFPVCGNRGLEAAGSFLGVDPAWKHVCVSEGAACTACAGG